MTVRLRLGVLALAGALSGAALLASSGEQTAGSPAAKPDPRLDRLKKEVIGEIDGLRDFTQQVVDQVFSFGELGFQEVETSRYLVGLLRTHGFTVEGISGVPTAWMATWGSGRPVIALGSDIDGIPRPRSVRASPIAIR